MHEVGWMLIRTCIEATQIRRQFEAGPRQLVKLVNVNTPKCGCVELGCSDVCAPIGAQD